MKISSLAHVRCIEYEPDCVKWMSKILVEDVSCSMRSWLALLSNAIIITVLCFAKSYEGEKAVSGYEPEEKKKEGGKSE